MLYFYLFDIAFNVTMMYNAKLGPKEKSYEDMVIKVKLLTL